MTTPSRTLSRNDARIIKSLAAASLKQSDISALLGVNQGRVSEVVSGETFAETEAADLTDKRVQRHLAALATECFERLRDEVRNAVEAANRRSSQC